MVFTAIAALLSMYAQYQQMQQAEDVADINERQANLEAAAIQDKSLEDAQAIRQQTKQQLARQRAETAATGGQTTAGSPLDILKDTARFGAIDESRVLSGAGEAVQSKYNEAAQSRAKGKFARIQGMMKMGETAFSSASKVSDKWDRYKQADESNRSIWW